MTGPEDSQTGARPISVAELLAKNGTIGSPPVGGRRRRRRGNSDSVTVAELTGEIPVVSDDPEPEIREAPETREAPEASLVDTAVVPAIDTGHNGRDIEDDYEAHLEARAADPDPVEFRPRSRRPQYPSRVRDHEPSGTGAERMSPDPAIDTEATEATEDIEDSKASSLGPLFGGQSVADDLARQGSRTDDRADDRADDVADGADDFDEDLDDDFDHTEVDEPLFEGSPLVRGLWIVGQCIIAVAFGAGLFVAFDQLWKWNTIVALVLGVLVILGLAGGVRVVRKTEDIGSTLTAVAVGALVTFGPLALLQAH